MRKQITHEGEISLGGFSIPCYVLDDGTRVLSGRAMQETLKMVDDENGKQTAGTRLARYLGQKSLEPFIYKDKSVDHYTPIVCYKGSYKINGTALMSISDSKEQFDGLFQKKYKEFVQLELEFNEDVS